jgi:hypothetical protein
MLLCGCSALLDVDGVQCESSVQCVERGLGAECIDHVCVAASSPSPSIAPPVASDRCDTDSQCTLGATPRCLNGQCVSTSDAERWLCEREQPGEEPAADTVSFGFEALEFITGAPPVNLSIDACRISDVGCIDPVADFRADNPDGEVRLPLPVGFVGYLDIRGDGILPQLFYSSRPVREDSVGRWLPLVAPSTLTVLAGVAGVAVESGKGLLLIEAVDCAATPSGGIHFEASAGDSQPFYIVNRLPNFDVTVSVHDEEADMAAGGFLNVRPGFVTVNARLGLEGPIVATFNAQVRADGVTVIELYAGAP